MVDLRQVEGVLRMTQKDVVARRHRYVKSLVKENVPSIIIIRVGEKQWKVSVKEPENYLNDLATELLKGNCHNKKSIFCQILNALSRRRLSFEELKAIEIKVEKISS